MSRGPGRYRCTTYLKAWALGAKGWADEHIDHCSFCHPIVHGDGKHFIGSITEAAEQLHLSRLKRRRRFLVAGTALGLLALTGSLAYLLPSKANRGSSQPDGPLFAQSFGDLDRQYTSGGKRAIQKHLNVGAEPTVLMTIEWIAERGHANLADLLVVSTSDPRVMVRILAADTLLRFPPVPLKPFLAPLQSQLSTESEESVRILLKELVLTIQKA